MGKFITVDLSQVKALRETVAAAGPALAASAATQVTALTQLEFRQEGRMFHGGWAPLSTGVSKAKTARKRKANGKPGKARKAKPVLVDTGTLKNSFFVTQSGNGATVGTPVKYAAYHQFGAPAANLPARPFLPVDADGNLLAKAEPYVRRAVEARLKQILPK